MINVRLPRRFRREDPPSPPPELVTAPATAAAPATATAAVSSTPKPKGAALAPAQERDSWLDRLIADGFLTLVGLAFWGANAAFTVAGFMLLGVMWPIGLVIHLGISKVELVSWRRARDSWLYLIAFVVCVAIDAGTTLFGGVALLGRFAPRLLAGAPADVLLWRSLATWPVPEWWPLAIVFSVLSIVLALAAERVLKQFWTGLKATWRERYA